MADPLTKMLVVFDFDHTVIDGNSDVELQALHPSPFPEEVKRLYGSDGWTDYMGAIFALLHSNDVKADEIKSKIMTIPLVRGMKELFEYLRADAFEVVIISDANTLFIDWLLEIHQIQEQVGRVYSNPAQFNEEGKLTIQYYHHQDWCQLSSKNLCKGSILETHIKERRGAGLRYSSVFYVGDGSNDFCPTLRLSANDYVFPRIDYALDRKLKQEGSSVKATVVPWDCAKTIMKTLQSAQS